MRDALRFFRLVELNFLEEKDRRTLSTLKFFRKAPMSQRLSHFTTHKNVRLKKDKAAKNISYSSDVHFLRGLFDQRFSLETLREILSENGDDMDVTIDILMLEERQSDRDSSREHLNIDSAAAELAALFPDILPSKLEAVLNRNAFNMEESVEEVLKERDTSFQSTITSDAELSILCEIFQAEPISNLERALRNANGNLEQSIQLLSLTERDCDGGCIPQGYPCMKHTDFVATSRKTGPMPRISSNVQKFNIGSSSLGGASSTPKQSTGNPIVEVRKPIKAADWREARESAHALARERAVLFHKAASAFRRGDQTGRGSAQFYADEVF